MRSIMSSTEQCVKHDNGILNGRPAQEIGGKALQVEESCVREEVLQRRPGIVQIGRAHV